MTLSTYNLEYMAVMLHDAVVAAVMHTHPQAIFLAMITMRKSTYRPVYGLPFLSHFTCTLYV